MQKATCTLLPGARLRDEILSTLVIALTDGKVKREHLSSLRQTASMARIDRYIDEHPDHLVGLQGVCSGTGIAIRTLERIIRSRTGLTALDYLKRRRLAFARRALLEPNDSTTVTSAAIAFGFLHFSRFFSEYRRAYGELPSLTLARSKGA